MFNGRIRDLAPLRAGKRKQKWNASSPLFLLAASCFALCVLLVSKGNASLGERNISSLVNVPVSQPWALYNNNQSENATRCTHPADHADPCHYITSQASCKPGGLIDYLSLLYCRLKGREWAMYLLLAVVMLTILSAVQIMADEYLAPNLISLSEALHLPQNIAGVTFLALGNGSSDMLSCLAAMSRDTQSAGMAVAGLYGGGLFVTTVVLGSVCLTGPFETSRRPFLRDACFYLFAALLTAGILKTGRMYMTETVFYAAVYCVYVAVVVIGRWAYKYRKLVSVKDVAQPEYGAITEANAAAVTTANQQIPAISEKLTPQHSEGLSVYLNTHSQIGQPSAFVLHQWDEDEEGPRDEGTQRDVERRRHSIESERPVTPHPLRRCKSLSPSIGQRYQNGHHAYGVRYPGRPDLLPATEGSAAALEVPDTHDDAEDETTALSSTENETWHEAMSHSAPRHSVAVFGRRQGLDERDGRVADLSDEWSNSSLLSLGDDLVLAEHIDWWKYLVDVLSPCELGRWHEASIAQRLLICLKYPLTIFFVLSVPVFNPDLPGWAWNRPLHLLQCVTVPVACLLLLGASSHTACYAALGVGMVGFAIVYFTCTNEKPPKPHAIVAFIGFLMGIVWIKMLSRELVSLLSALGVIFNIRSDILGMTVLAWANNIQDWAVDTAVAQSGHPAMAVGAIFGGPLLNMLMGMSMGSFVALLSHSPLLLPLTGPLLLVAVALVCSLLASLVIVPLRGFRMDPIYGKCLYAFYSFYILAVGLYVLFSQ